MTEGEFTALIQLCRLRVMYRAGWWLIRTRDGETIGHLTEADIDTAINSGNWSPLAAQVRRMMLGA